MAQAIHNPKQRPSMCEDALIGRDRDPPPHALITPATSAPPPSVRST
jgi:hypothetical protein